MKEVIQLNLTPKDQASLALAKAGMTEDDTELARALFATERFGDATLKAGPIPPIYLMLAYNLRDMTNREMVRNLLETPPGRIK